MMDLRSTLLLLLVATGAACDRSAPASETPGPVADDGPVSPADPDRPPEPPACADLGEATSEVVGDLDATILVFDCDPGPGAEILLNGRIWNHGTATVQVQGLSLAYPMLVFEVRDGAGVEVPGGPPPVPPSMSLSNFVKTLQPDADYMWDAALSGVVATDLPPGPYEIRLVYEHPENTDGWWAGRLETPWVRFELP
ncbi:MAG: hypothetical protein JXB32_22640 [Deltaproteobacteria bacterium]|nr:hypothetical protein [Deltaproteobacteria bacterium]